MQISFSKHFNRQYQKAPLKIRETFDYRYRLFVKNPFDPILNNHPLKGELKGLRSINITGDWRAFYSFDKKNSVTFHTLGTHSQLYR